MTAPARGAFAGLTPAQETVRRARLRAAIRRRRRERLAEEEALSRALPRCEVCSLLEPHTCIGWRNQ